jgi:hypothetical protein
VNIVYSVNKRSGARRLSVPSLNQSNLFFEVLRQTARNTKMRCAQFSKYLNRIINEPLTIRLQQDAQGTDDSQSMIGSHLPATPFVNQNETLFHFDGELDGLSFAQI